MLCRTKRRKRIRRKIIIVAAFLVCIIVLFEIQAIPFTAKCIKKQSKSVSTKLISDIVAEVTEEMELTYDDMTNVKYTDDGNLSSVSTDTVVINKLKSAVTNKIQKKLDSQTVNRFYQPLGSFTQLSFLSTFGPEVEINFTLTGSVNCKVESTFSGAGVNQTIHHIRLIVQTDIISLSPGFNNEQTFTTDYELTQTVIVGSVPSTYADIVK